jgi:uncharacterized membrane protein YfhO
VKSAPDYVVMEVEGPGVLTLSQVYYPGWHASVDSRPAVISTAQALMSVSLSAGQHVIEFKFDPWTVKTGWLVSAVGWGSLFFGCMVGWLRGRSWKRVER